MIQLTREGALSNYGRLVLRGFLEAQADALEKELKAHHGDDSEDVAHLMQGIRSDIQERTS